MPRAARRLALLPAILLLALPSPAAADWLITPFVGAAFARETTLLVLSLDPDQGSSRKLTLGASVALASDGWLGLEADVSHTPGFFNEDHPMSIVATSRVTTMTGSVMLAAPLSVTRESLRPYLVGGLGLVQARSKHQGDVLPVDRNVLGLTLGAGVYGMVSDRSGLRFEIRHLKAITGEDGVFAREGVSRLSFWRVTAGVTLRY